MTTDSQTPWVDGLTFHEVVSKSVADHPDNDAVVFPQLDLRWNYAEFQERTYEMSRALLAMGIQKGDHVGIWSTNWPEWILAQFSAAYIGAVLVNVNPAYRQHEVAFIIKQADLAMLLITDEHKTSDYVSIVANTVPEVSTTPWDHPLNCDEFPELKHIVCLKNVDLPQGIGSWDAFIAKASGATLDAVTKEKCTVLYGVPTMFSAQVNHPNFSQFDTTSLRTGMMAGSPCPIELMKKIGTDMHIDEITIGFGQTETSPIITHAKATDSLEKRVTTVGTAIPGVECRVVDPETLEDVPLGEQGEFWARGHNIMLGYYNNPEATANTITEDGWLRTGDLATETPDHFYKITGRIKDMIIRGGENIYPAEIENFLLSHPDILEVQVAGLPDLKFGEQVCAWIIPKPDSQLTVDSVKEFCKEKIAHYKIPHYVTLLQEFPLTVTGKIQKFRLRDMGIEEYGLQEAAAEKTA